MARFGLWYDFRDPGQWQRPSDRLCGEILDQITWAENNASVAAHALTSVRLQRAYSTQSSSTSAAKGKCAPSCMGTPALSEV